MCTKKITVAVAGAGGLAGGELLRLLLLHPHVAKVTALSNSQAEKKIADVHPSLRHLSDMRFSSTDLIEVAKEADVMFFAMPHGKSMNYMPDVVSASKSVIIDLAGDFRIYDEEIFSSSYCKHTCFDLVKEFCYGLPELNKAEIKTNRLIANPGCFATAVELSLLPLAAKKLLPASFGIYAVTGSSGSGIKPKAATHHPHRASNYYAYKLLAHQHEAEINQSIETLSGQSSKIRLLAHSAPFIRGIYTTCYLENPQFEKLNINELYQDYYKPHCFVWVSDQPVKLGEVIATNYAHINISQQGSELAVTLALDNLVKGAAGQAIQNMNLVLGLSENAGLTHPGAFPC